MSKKGVKKPVKRLKRLDDAFNAAEIDEVRVPVTLKTVDESELADLAPKRLFLLKPKVKQARFCYISCHRVVLSYSVSYFSNRRRDDGQLTFIVDDKKGTGVIEDNMKLQTVRKAIDEDLIEEAFFSDEQAVKKAIVDARWKVLLAKYKKPPELELVSSEKFYRPYYEVTYAFGGKEKTAWIPADKYGTYFVYQ